MQQLVEDRIGQRCDILLPVPHVAFDDCLSNFSLTKTARASVDLSPCILFLMFLLVKSALHPSSTLFPRHLLSRFSWLVLGTVGKKPYINTMESATNNHAPWSLHLTWVSCTWLDYHAINAAAEITPMSHFRFPHHLFRSSPPLPNPTCRMPTMLLTLTRLSLRRPSTSPSHCLRSPEFSSPQKRKTTILAKTPMKRMHVFCTANLLEPPTRTIPMMKTYLGRSL